MKLPHFYKGFTITARKKRTSRISKPFEYQLIARNSAFGKVITYAPGMHVIYIGYENPPIAYDHDIQEIKKMIDHYLKKSCKVGGCGNFTS